MGREKGIIKLLILNSSLVGELVEPLTIPCSLITSSKIFDYAQKILRNMKAIAN
ncbi:hypothetical protein [Rivularia sp. UHCC 0363]|uniref:hypothetical protein n=1 Tax=Rivularia sp. UHCC 0363 TaxID=3110244 RepID=UPI002B1F7710|nr:hypothetical protein [Rivularia sp. UHCC 0363]MEA5593898.1 hypothetical protein [Rivularia sp. UHCC 0363]